MKDQSINSFKDFSDFSATERELAEIWKRALSLSDARHNALTQESDFWALSGWCATIPYNLLKRQIESIFGIVLDDSFEDCSTFSEQAAWIDFRVENRLIFDFLTNWITTAYDSRTELTVKQEKIVFLPDRDRTKLQNSILQSPYAPIIINDIQLTQLQAPTLTRATVKVTGYLPSIGALARTESFELEFILDMNNFHQPKISSVHIPKS